MILAVSLIDFKSLTDKDYFERKDSDGMLYIYQLQIDWGDGSVDYIPYESEYEWSEMTAQQKKSMLKTLYTEALHGKEE